MDCGRCEAMLADAVDGMLSAEEQQFFEAHIAECTACAQLLAEARRGAAWLEMLRSPAPEPPAMLLEKILAQTSGTMLHPASMAHPAPAMAHGYTNVVPFPRRAASAMRANAFGRIAFEPRLAMTAAMAFLSIALTLDLMGVNPLALHARDLTPSGLHRAFGELDARVAQYYDGLRVVYELESRVHEFENVQENARDAAPAAQGQQPANANGSPQVDPAGENQPDQQEQAAPEQQEPQEDETPQAAPQATPDQQQPGGKSSLELGEPERRAA